ncbi:MAG TPA: FkbM family methyltransferase [Pirellulales bacterium]|nr:FkbM family methyltransferase [Pirellulales bacterium]
MSIKHMIPDSLKAHVKELLGIGRLQREVETRRAAHQSAEVRLKQLEERTASAESVAGLTKDIDLLRREIEACRATHQAAELQIKQLEDRMASAERVAGFTKNIDMLRVDDFFYFVYEGDTAHRVFPPDHRRQHAKLSPTEICSIVANARTSEARRDFHTTDAVARALWSLAKSDQPVNLIYVGCNYGFHLMKLADFVLKQNLNCRIVAFDPGIAGTLAAPIFRLNDFHNIEFFNVGVSCANSYAIMHLTAGHSEDNKLVNLTDSPLRFSRLIETVTLDAFCSRHRIAGPTVLVIDTQGNEPEVVSGALDFLKNNVCVIVSEFTPWALSDRISGQDYLARLTNFGRVYDMGDDQAPRIDGAVSLLREKVTAENWDAFTSRIYNNAPHWTDVMVIPEDHDLGRLVAEDLNVASL